MSFPYNFITKRFKADKVNYNVAITPVLFGDTDGLDFSGAVTGILISEIRGTIHFTIEDYGDGEWVCSEGLLEEAVARKIVDIYHSKPKTEYEFKLYRQEIGEPELDEVPSGN